MKTDTIRPGPGSRIARPFRRLPAALGLAAILLLLLGAIGGSPARAAGATAVEPQVTAALISAQTAVGEARQIRLGLRFTMAPGWKTYWRSPGDAGFPPEIKFDGSENVASAVLQYPTPHRFELAVNLRTAQRLGLLLPTPLLLQATEVVS